MVAGGNAAGCSVRARGCSGLVIGVLSAGSRLLSPISSSGVGNIMYKRRETLTYMLHRHHPNRHMSVGGARNAVETVGELDGHYDAVFGAARAETHPNIAVR